MTNTERDEGTGNGPFFHATPRPDEYLFNNFSAIGVNYTDTISNFTANIPAHEERG